MKIENVNNSKGISNNQNKSNLNSISPPLVSVIIPTYNYAHFIKFAIDSVLKQNYDNVEIIVIDDGSTDNTFQVIKSIKGIKYFKQKNQGLSSARNQGIRLASGKYIQFLDADDILGSNTIRKRVEYLEKNIEKSLVICRSKYVYDKAMFKCFLSMHSEWQLPESYLIDLSLYYFNIAPPHAFLVRKSAIDTHSIVFDTSLRACEDYDFWFRLVLYTGLPGLINSCWVYYRQHSSSMSRSYKNQFSHDAELCQRIFLITKLTGKWLGSRPISDYYAAMLAASIITARRLWYVDRVKFSDFLYNHVMPLKKKFLETQEFVAVTPFAYNYFAISHMAIYKMRYFDQSIKQSDYRKLIHGLFSNNSFAILALKSKFKDISSRLLWRLIKYDLYKTWLYLKYFIKNIRIK